MKKILHLFSVIALLGFAQLTFADEVKLKRAELEIKEKEIINNNQDIEKTLNENLISKDSNNLKSSIMNEKDRLYKILKTKDNEEKANYYLDYTKNIDLIAWLLLTIAGVEHIY